MNDYIVHYADANGCNHDSSSITARSEAAAKRVFRSMMKDVDGIVINNIILHRENTSATKQQERQTLEKIRQMVEELGPDSYLRTAFEGCFQDAEDNIEDDAAYSMKSRWKSSENKLEAANQEIDRLNAVIIRMTATIEKLKADNEEYRVKTYNRTITSDDLKDSIQLVKDHLDKLIEDLKSTGEQIIEYADDPSSDEFINAVSWHRKFKHQIEYYRDLHSRLIALQKNLM